VILDNHGIWKDIETWNGIVKDEIKRSVNEFADMEKLIKKVSKGIVLRTLRKLTDYSIILRVKSNIVIDVVKKWGLLCNINNKFIRELIIEIKTYQPINEFIFVPMQLHLRKMHSLRLQCKSSGKLIALSQSLKYFDDPKELLCVLLLSKSVNKVLRLDVYKQVLLRTHLQFSNPQRVIIWQHLLLCVSYYIITRTIMLRSIRS